uniref:Uncharacterized protein n=1 Tax=Brassica oleracea var. oleracea TaxID=109376 RepID=A0A0D3E699_BRAOL
MKPSFQKPNFKPLLSSSTTATSSINLMCLIHQSCASSTFLYQEQKKIRFRTERERERERERET